MEDSGTQQNGVDGGADGYQRACPSLTMSTRPPIIDIHSHIYPASWIALLRSRNAPPCIDSDANTLVNRPGVTGNPLLSSLYDIATKIQFMDEHGVDISVLSRGNPWLEFLITEKERAEAGEVAVKINQELEDMCRANEGKLYYVAVLPLTALMPVVLEIGGGLSTQTHCRGVVIGYAGFMVWSRQSRIPPGLQAIAKANLPVFFHPNYGLPNDIFGPCCNSHGQVLPISLGFTTETAVAFTRMYLANVFDKIPGLLIVLPHGGGTLPVSD